MGLVLSADDDLEGVWQAALRPSGRGCAPSIQQAALRPSGGLRSVRPAGCAASIWQAALHPSGGLRSIRPVGCPFGGLRSVRPVARKSTRPSWPCLCLQLVWLAPCPGLPPSGVGSPSGCCGLLSTLTEPISLRASSRLRCVRPVGCAPSIRQAALHPSGGLRSVRPAGCAPSVRWAALHPSGGLRSIRPAGCAPSVRRAALHPSGRLRSVWQAALWGPAGCAVDMPSQSDMRQFVVSRQSPQDVFGRVRQSAHELYASPMVGPPPILRPQAVPAVARAQAPTSPAAPSLAVASPQG